MTLTRRRLLQTVACAAVLPTEGLGEVPDYSQHFHGVVSQIGSPDTAGPNATFGTRRGGHGIWVEKGEGPYGPVKWLPPA